MVRVVIYGEKPADIEGLEKMLCEILTENRRWPMIHTYISDLDAYLHFVKGNPYLIMLASVLLLAFSFLLAKNLDTELMAEDDQGQITITAE